MDDLFAYFIEVRFFVTVVFQLMLKIGYVIVAGSRTADTSVNNDQMLLSYRDKLLAIKQLIDLPCHYYNLLMLSKLSPWGLLQLYLFCKYSYHLELVVIYVVYSNKTSALCSFELPVFILLIKSWIERWQHILTFIS